MKKIITVLMAAALMLSLVACGGGNGGNTNTPSGGNDTPTTQGATEISTPEPNETKNTAWAIGDGKDDFGDLTGDKFIAGMVFGSFSNTATNNSELSVGIVCYLLPNGNPSFLIRLQEYGDLAATYLASDDIILKTRIDGNDNEYILIGQPPNGLLMINPMEDTSIEFFNALYDGKEISCIIDIGSSKYRFTIDGTDFAKLYDELQELHQLAEAAKAAEEAKALEEANALKEVELAEGTITGKVTQLLASSDDHGEGISVWIFESSVDIIDTSGVTVVAAVFFGDDAELEEINIGDIVTISGSILEGNGPYWKQNPATNEQTKDLDASFEIKSAELIEHQPTE